jgi:AraC family transcriptional regulator
LWGQFLHRLGEVQHRVGSTMYGVITALPGSQRSHPHELQYLAGVAVHSIADLPAGMMARPVPAGTYAVFLHRGPIQKIRDTVTEIYRDWLPQSGYVQSAAPDVELYDHRFHLDRDDSEMEYWVGVTPKADA